MPSNQGLISSADLGWVLVNRPWVGYLSNLLKLVDGDHPLFILLAFHSLEEPLVSRLATHHIPPSGPVGALLACSPNGALVCSLTSSFFFLPSRGLV